MDTLFMPSRLSHLGSMGIKIVTGAPENEERGLPVSLGLVAVFDDSTGLPLAVMEGGYLTDMRTGALSAVACEYLARSDSRVLGMIGTGAQARTQVLAIAEVLGIEEVRVFSRRAARVDAFVEMMSGALPNVRFQGVESAEHAARDADVIVCATSSKATVLQREWVSPGACVCGVGSHTPEDREVAGEIVRDASIVVADSRKGILASAGDVMIPVSEGLVAAEDVVELGELVLGRKRGRQSADEITFFKSIGFAAIDVLLGAALFDRAKERQLGLDVPLYGGL